MKKLLICSFLFLLLGVPASSAWAHSDLVSSDPEEGVRLPRPPHHAYLNFKEAPTAGSKLKITDGCGRDVIADLERIDLTLHANLEKGQPGQWRVTYDVISQVDGHLVKGSYDFTVRGQSDCSEPEPDPSQTDGDTVGPGDDTDPGELTSSETDPSFPVVSVVIGALVLVGGAIFVRTRTAR